MFLDYLRIERRPAAAGMLLNYRAVRGSIVLAVDGDIEIRRTAATVIAEPFIPPPPSGTGPWRMLMGVGI